MKINSSKLRELTIWTVIGLSGLSVLGCHGASDTAPTNTAHSQYNNSGKSAADQIGADRARAHRRLPPKGSISNPNGNGSQ